MADYGCGCAEDPDIRCQQRGNNRCLGGELIDGARWNSSAQAVEKRLANVRQTSAHNDDLRIEQTDTTPEPCCQSLGQFVKFGFPDSIASIQPGTPTCPPSPAAPFFPW